MTDYPFDIARAEKLERLAGLAAQQGDKQLELKVLREMKKMQTEVEGLAAGGYPQQSPEQLAQQAEAANQGAPSSINVFENLPEETVGKIRAEPEEYGKILAGLPPEAVQNVLEIAQIKSERASNPRTQAMGISKHEIKRLAELERLRLKNPYLADELENMGTGEAALIGMGEGFASIGRGLGLMDPATDDERRYSDALREQHPIAEGTKVLGQAAPFVPLGVGAGAIASTPGRVAAMGGVGALEGGTIARGEGGDSVDAAIGASLGLVLGSAGELAIPVASRAARRFVAKLRGQEPDAPLITPDGRPTPELQAELDKAGLSYDDMLKEYESPRNVTETIAEGAQLDERSLGERLDEIIASAAPSQSKVRAAEDLGLDVADIPPPVLTDSQAFAELGGALSAVPGSVASEGLDQFTAQLSRKADDIIQEMGGSLDKGAVSTEFKDRILNTRNLLYDAENEIYKEVAQSVPRDARIGTLVSRPIPGITSTGSKLPLVKQLEAEGREVGGVKNLNKHTRRIYLILKNNPTYAKLDAERKAIGSALSRKGGVYADAEEGTLKKLYGQLTDLQGQFADQYPGAKTLWDKAKSVTVQRKALEENSQLLFGKDLATGIIPTLESGLKRLPAGDYKKFDQMMQAIPEQERAAILATALNGVFSGSARSVNKSLTATDYTKWFGSLKRSPQAYSKIKKYLPEGGIERLESLNTLAEGLADVSRKRTRTGIVKTIFDDFDKADGMVAKLYNLADRSPVGVSQSVRIASSLAKAASKEKTASVTAADKLLSSPTFRRAFLEAANDPGSAAAKKGESVLKKSKPYKDYLKQQTPDRKESILTMGLIPFLMSDEEGSQPGE